VIDDYAERRARMVDSQIRARGVQDPLVLQAMRRVERHRFVPERERELAYGDHPVDIGFGQTISQPYIVAYMTAALAIDRESKVLEIGTGSAYQTAVLAEIARQVYSIEFVPQHALRAAQLLTDLGYGNVSVRQGDGYGGWPDAAPFDAIIVTAAPDHVPQPLVEQLKVGGRLVVPVGTTYQDLLVLTRTESGLREDDRLGVRFVPLVRSQ
jgi:protein-L-isoaspartate(D-aspartate) O-methyltransferase